MMKQEKNMSIQQLDELATRLTSIANYALEIAMTPEEIIEEINYLSRKLRQEAAELDAEMERVFLREYA